MTPHELAERRIQLSAEYARDAELLSDILAQKPAMWNSIREHVKSDTAADRQWEATPEGIGEMQLKLRMKSAEKKMSAAKTMLEVMTNEANNKY